MLQLSKYNTWIYIQIITGHKYVDSIQDIDKSFRLISNNEDLQMPDKAFTLNNNS